MRFSRVFLSAILVLTFSGAAFSQDSTRTFSVREFWLEFENDRQKAETEFIGKTLKYTGVVVETGMSIYLTPNVRLSDNPDGRIYLICVLPRGDVGTLKEYKKGETVTMIGRVYRSRPDGGVVAKECRRTDS